MSVNSLNQRTASEVGVGGPELAAPATGNNEKSASYSEPESEIFADVQAFCSSQGVSLGTGAALSAGVPGIWLVQCSRAAVDRTVGSAR